MHGWKLSALCLSLLLGACAASPAPMAIFRARPDSPNARLVVELGPARAGISGFLLHGGPLKSAVISGEAEADGGGWKIKLEKLEWFDNWPNGWTQAAFVLDGRAELRPAGGGWLLDIEEAPTLDMVESASIRYFDTYVRGDQGLTEFLHRWQRIQAVVDDLTRRFPGDWPRDGRLLRRHLFPEIYGYDSPPARDHQRLNVQGIQWNTDYTVANFPEALRPLRDSGTMLRDYKESPGLWFLDLAWKNLWDGKSQPTLLRKE